VKGENLTSPVLKRVLKILAWIVGTALALFIFLGLCVTIRWDEKWENGITFNIQDLI
jgi:hypothetical protein